MKRLLVVFVLTLTVLLCACRAVGIDQIAVDGTQAIAPTETAVTTPAPTAEPSPQPVENAAEVFGKMGGEFMFASGAGAWSTTLNVHADGRFDGLFHDSDAGVPGTNYYNGVKSLCAFSGTLGRLERINDYTYSVRIEAIQYENEPDTNEFKDGVKYRYTTPYGLEGAEEILIYTPDAPVEQLPERFLFWASRIHSVEGTVLGSYGLYNVKEEYGFIQ